MLSARPSTATGPSSRPTIDLAAFGPPLRHIQVEVVAAEIAIGGELFPIANENRSRRDPFDQPILFEVA